MAVNDPLLSGRADEVPMSVLDRPQSRRKGSTLKAAAAAAAAGMVPR